ncbi:beta-propeller domain-containing protein [Actinoplanes sp. NPDC026619]|uniref:beta-propeller domain-containing protein n=1 Tax=Actinoplanes sp. NPDC026619 TaxID=3155798 RepID=UPI0033C5C6CE
MRRRNLLSAVAFTLAGCTALTLAGCTAATPTELPAPTAPPARPQLSLVAFDSCDRLLSELRAATQRSVATYGLTAPVPEAASMTGRAEVSIAPVPYSGTNVHEQGADEPDIVKTDGRRIVTVDRGMLRVIDPATRSLTGSLALGAPGSQLLLSGDHALVLTTGRTYAGRIRPGLLPASGDVDLVLVDLAGPPKILSRYRSIGRVVDARQTGSIARIVLSSIPSIKFPMTATGDDALLRENKKAVGAAPIDAWLPSWQVTTGTAVSEGRLDCGAVRRPKSFSGAAMLSLLTFDLGASALTDGDPVGVVADGEIVYGTPSTLYIANDPSRRFNALPGAEALGTEIFQFSLPNTGKPVLIGAGTIAGTLLNQYSMSEWDGRLRVATTAKNDSAVRILENHGGDLVQAGKVGGLGRGERIYAVRFIGDRGYVVTFRQTDPLYSLDLSDWTAPRVTGELKITGYSAHLQPVGDNLLIGIGQEASTQGVRQGMLVSLFDVEDPANPRRLASQVVANSVSAAEWDPHALLWWPAAKLLVVPVKGSAQGALAYRVEDGQLQAAGRISGDVSRSLVIGDDLWTLRENGLQVASVSTLDTLATVSF